MSSLPPDATVWPSGENATAQTSSRWFAKELELGGGLGRQIDMSWSPPRNRRSPSGAKEMYWNVRRPGKTFSRTPVAIRQMAMGTAPPGWP